MSPRRITFLLAFVPLLVPSLALGLINFLQNPGFATDLSSWTVPTYTTGAWSPKNRSGSGGSALLTSAATNAASAPNAAILQCVAASPGHTYAFGASLWVPADVAPTAQVTALIDVRFFSDASCASSLTQLDQVVVSADPSLRDTWIDVQGHRTAPAGTQSALIGIAAVDFAGSSTAETVQVYVDDAFFYSDATCATSADRLCLGDRFLVYGDWVSPTQQGYMHALPVTVDSGLFWFFSPDNLEIFAKVLNACGPALNNHFWVFASGLTNVQVHMHVDDTVSGETREYDNAAGTAFAPVQDTSAFATCP